MHGPQKRRRQERLGQNMSASLPLYHCTRIVRQGTKHVSDIIPSRTPTVELQTMAVSVWPMATARGSDDCAVSAKSSHTTSVDPFSLMQSKTLILSLFSTPVYGRLRFC